MYFITRGVFRIFRKYRIMDKPHLYSHEKNRTPLPYPGGVVLILNLVLWSPWIFFAVSDADIKKAMYVLIAGLITTALMAWDDQKRSIPPVFRLLFQIGL